MKASERLRIAENLINRANKHMVIVGNKLAKILDDDCVHICDQASDGLVVAYDGGYSNSSISFSNIDKLVKMNKEDLFKELERWSI
jgi:hypothetical protein